MLSVLISMLIVVDVASINAERPDSNKTCGGLFVDCEGRCVDTEEFCSSGMTCSNNPSFDAICNVLGCPGYAYLCDPYKCFDKDISCDGVIDCESHQGFGARDELFIECPSIQNDCGTFFSDDPKDIFPWHAGVWLETDEGSIKICAATVITRRHIVTVAECFWNAALDTISEETFTITAHIVNDTFLQSNTVKKIHLNNYHHNIAVAEVQNPFVFGEDFYPACLFDYKLKYFQPNVYTSIIEEMVTWTPGPNNYDRPLRLELTYWLNPNPIVQSEYEPANFHFKPRAKKYLRAADKCGPISDQGGGTVLHWRGRYFLHGVINPPVGNASVMSCLYRILTYVTPHLDFIRSVVDFDETTAETSHVSANRLQTEARYRLNVSLVPPKSLRESCGKFDILDEEGSFPWHGVVWLKTVNRPEELCSHTIISESLVISAASCFWDSQTGALRDEGSLVATAGLKGRSFVQYRNVLRVIIQDDFASSNIEHIALLLLEEPFEFNDIVGPVCVYHPDVVSTLSGSTDRVGIMISMQYCAEQIHQVRMEFLRNEECIANLSSVEEKFTLCLNMLSDRFFIQQCLSPLDTGAGLFIIEGGRYFLRGILNPRTIEFVVFTNLLPYLSSVAKLQAEIDLIPPKLVIKSVEDLKRAMNTTTMDSQFNATLPSSLVAILDFETCTPRFGARSCDLTNDDCDDGSFGEYSCHKNKTTQECSFAFCEGAYACRGSVSCSLNSAAKHEV